jgi:hypothetical protein
VKDSASGKTNGDDSDKSPKKDDEKIEHKPRERVSVSTERKLKKDKPLTSLELIRLK